MRGKMFAAIPTHPFRACGFEEIVIFFFVLFENKLNHVKFLYNLYELNVFQKQKGP